MNDQRFRYRNRIAACCMTMAVSLSLLTGCGKVDDDVAKGMESLKALDYRSALESFAIARNNQVTGKELARGEGIAHMGLAEYDAAAECFLEALSYSDGWVEDIDYDVNFYLAAAYSKKGMTQEAQDIYNAILELQPKNEDALFLRGCTRLKLKDYLAAKDDFDKVVALNGKNFDRLIQIYEVLYHYDHKEAGVAYLREALDAYESQMSAYDKGRMYYYLQDYQQAYLALETAKDEGDAEAYLYLGKSYEATGDYNYASSVYHGFLQKGEADARIYNQLGLCEMAKGDYEKALDAFQAGMKLENNSVMQSLQFNEAITYEYLREYQKAYVLLGNYLKTYPDDATAKREYDFLSTR